MPGRNQQRDEVMAELKELVKEPNSNVLILPFATIIETGNHIAHCGDGHLKNIYEETLEPVKLRN